MLEYLARTDAKVVVTGDDIIAMNDANVPKSVIKAVVDAADARRNYRDRGYSSPRVVVTAPYYYDPYYYYDPFYYPVYAYGYGYGACGYWDPYYCGYGYYGYPNVLYDRHPDHGAFDHGFGHGAATDLAAHGGQGAVGLDDRHRYVHSRTGVAVVLAGPNLGSQRGSV